MNNKKMVALLRRVKSGELPETQSNLEKVQRSFCEIVAWNTVFEDAGLADLPDDDDKLFTEGPQLLRQWMQNAFVNHGRDPAKVSAALDKVEHNIQAEQRAGKLIK
jgi:hypothetical protein